MAKLKRLQKHTSQKTNAIGKNFSFSWMAYLILLLQMLIMQDKLEDRETDVPRIGTMNTDMKFTMVTKNKEERYKVQIKREKHAAKES